MALSSTYLRPILKAFTTTIIEEDDMASAGDVIDQLLGPVGSDGKRGWPQLGDAEVTGVDKRSIVDGLARIIQQENFAIAQNDRIEKRQIALLAASNIVDPTVKK